MDAVQMTRYCRGNSIMRKAALLAAALVLALPAFADNQANSNPPPTASKPRPKSNYHIIEQSSFSSGTATPVTLSNNPCKQPNPPHDCRRPRPPH
jgi:hypothetical protein